MAKFASKADVVEAFKNFDRIRDQIDVWAAKTGILYMHWPNPDEKQTGFNLISSDFALSLYWPRDNHDYETAVGFHNINNSAPAWQATTEVRAGRCYFNGNAITLVGQPKTIDPFEIQNIGSLASLEQLVSLARGNPARVELHDGLLSDIATAEADRIAKGRIGQARCRARALEDWKSVCAISGCSVPEALDCAHIVNWASRSQRGVANNFLLLRADLHRLFDRDILKIDPDSLMVSINTNDASFDKFDGAIVDVPTTLDQAAVKKLLAERYAQ